MIPKGAKKPKAQVVEMLDGRVYWSFDNWTTVERQWPSGLITPVKDKDEADKVRFIAICQSSASA